MLFVHINISILTFIPIKNILTFTRYKITFTHSFSSSKETKTTYKFIVIKSKKKNIIRRLNVTVDNFIGTKHI